MKKPAYGLMFRCQYPPEDLVTFARQTEAAGFDELWVVEDCFFAGGVSSATVALASTQSIPVGLGIMPAVARNPAFAAMEIAALARFYPGRFLPGFGHGVADWMRQIGAFPTSQLKALEETTVVVRALLRGESVTFHGQHVNLDNVRLDFPPTPVPPISLGVRSLKSITMSGRVADGTIIAEGSSPAYVRWTREQIATGMQAAGHAGDSHRLTVYVWCIVDQNRQAAHNSIRPKLAGMLAGSENDSQFAPLGIMSEVRQLLEKGGKTALEQQMPDEWVTALAAVGTPQDCADAVRRLVDAGADAVIFVPPTDQTSVQQRELIASQVLPLLRQGS